MHVKDAIGARRAYRSLENVEISEEVLDALAESARLAPSCFNNQPWRFVFVVDGPAMARVMEALPAGNAWAKAASMVVAVASRPQDDCVVGDRTYNLFDTGMATAFLILRATELGLVAHPIAGFNPPKVKAALAIPEDYQLITILVVGRKADGIGPLLSEKQAEAEGQRPPRKAPAEFAFQDSFGDPIGGR